MTETNSFTRQPTKIDYASPTQFKFGIIKLPKVEFFVTSVNLPGISMDAINQSTYPAVILRLHGHGSK